MIKSKLSFWMFQVGLLCCLLAIVEVVLRYKGYQPGDMKPKWLNFQPVDSLYIIPDFYTNQEGILVANGSYFRQQMQLSINKDGFRTPEFADLDSSKKKVLLIGDSFTWGMTARPLDSSFADILRVETDYEIINTGIPAADPPQYAAIAERYIPLLSPDFVIVVFFTGNDIMKYDREVLPGEPFYYFTNAGAILADIDGIHFRSAQDAYNYVVNEKYYLHNPKNFFEKAVAGSSLLSRLYSVRFRIQEKLEYEKMIREAHVTKKYLNAIAGTCGKYNVPLKFVLIPEVKEADMALDDFRKKYSNLLEDNTLVNYWLLPSNSHLHFNDYPDAHLNNKGHRYYADYLKRNLSDFFENK